MSLVLHPSYFMDVASLIHCYHVDAIVWEKHGSYKKQTYRNRTNIAAANGALSLQIPIIHKQVDHSLLFTDIKIDNSQPWVSNHLKTIKSAYNSSPFYEFYEADFLGLYTDIPESLYEWNLKTASFLFHVLNLNKDLSFSKEFLNNAQADELIQAKGKKPILLGEYMQVFQEKFGFLSGLSSLDLLFNLGPSSGVWLKEQKSLVYF